MSDKIKEVVGYACEFADYIPKEVQTDCSICLHVLRDPQMVDCCCYRFCKGCIQRVLNTFSKCPLCNQRSPITIADKQLARTLKQKKVKCTYHREGCRWIGELSMLDDHLDTFQRVEGCCFKNMRCIYCNILLQKSEVEDHESKCLKKPSVCEYCYEYECLRHELAQHWISCRLYPIPCPKGCGATVTRSSISQHFEVSCSLAIVDCEFALQGCEIKVRRKDMKDHMTQSMEDHLALLLKMYSNLEIAYKAEKKRCRQLEVELEEVKSRTEKESENRDNEVSVLKTLCDLRAGDDFSDPKDQVLVENLPPTTTEQMIRSLFGQHGRLHQVRFYPSNLIGVVEYDSNYSLKCLFHKYNSTGIRLRGYQLKCVSLGY